VVDTFLNEVAAKPRESNANVRQQSPWLTSHWTPITIRAEISQEIGLWWSITACLKHRMSVLIPCNLEELGGEFCCKWKPLMTATELRFPQRFQALFPYKE
jgi:hypothetical protein